MVRTRREPSVRRDRAEVRRSLRVLAALAARHEEWLREEFPRVAAADEERIRQATAAAEESRKAEAEAREARRREDEARRKAEAEARAALRREDAEGWAALRRAEAEAREVRRREDEARRKADAERWAALRREEAEARRNEEARVREANRRDDLERKRRFEALIAEGLPKRDEALDAGLWKFEEALHRSIGEGDPLRGRVVVALTEESLPPILEEAGIVVAFVIERPGAWRRNGGRREWDLVAVGHRVTVVVEIEPILRMPGVRRCRSRMRTFREWRPEFDRRDMRIYGALAYVSAKPAALRFAERRGFLLIGVDDAGAGIRNSPGFEPSSF